MFIVPISEMLQAKPLLKRGQEQNLSCENDFFYYHANKTHFHKKGFALGLVLRVSEGFWNSEMPLY